MQHNYGKRVKFWGCNVVTMSGIGHDYMNGFRRGAEFQTEASSDIAAYKSELDGMSGLREFSHLVGAACGEFVGIISGGHFERKSYNEMIHCGGDDMAYLSDDFWDDSVPSEDRVRLIIAKYEAVNGKTLEDDEVDMGNDGLEGSVGDVEVGRHGDNRTVYEGTSSDREDEDETGYAGRRGQPTNVRDNDEHTVDRRGEKNRGPPENSRLEDSVGTRQETPYENEGNSNNGEVDRILANKLEKERERDRRIYGQEGALSRNLRKIGRHRLGKVLAYVDSGYMSTLGVPVVYTKDNGLLPGRERDLTEEEKNDLIKRVVFSNRT